MDSIPPCPLCADCEALVFHQDRRREYLRCQRCGLVYVAGRYHISETEEKSIYELHRNHPGDEGYRSFLARLSEPLIARLPARAQGLDFGCGPGPTLSVMLEEEGFSVALYDLFFAADESIWQRSYQFITATEVVEHLARPGPVLQQLWLQLESGGYLGLMTKLVLSTEAFSNWHYKNDPTHICFFSRQTWHWWAAHNNARLEILGADVILLQKT